MEVSLIQQLTVTVYSVFAGAVFGLLYDVLRISRIFLGINYVNKFTEKIKDIKLPLIENPMRKSAKKRDDKFKAVAVGIGDILYFLLITPMAVVFTYQVNDGNIRWYLLFGMVAGFALYYFTVGKIIISVSEYIVFFIKTVFYYLSYFILRPIKKGALFLLCKIKKLFVIVKSKIPKIHFRVKKREDTKRANAKPLIYTGKIM
ncbi:MAG: spore cortex biosynthesis protein YabQ [Eubacteriales bacterium]